MRDLNLVESNKNKKAISSLMASTNQTLETLRGLHDFVAFQTRGADLHPGRPTVHHGAHRLNIRKPSTASLVMGVADVVAADRFLAANITHFCHFKSYSFKF